MWSNQRCAPHSPKGQATKTPAMSAISTIETGPAPSRAALLPAIASTMQRVEGAPKKSLSTRGNVSDGARLRRVAASARAKSASASARNAAVCCSSMSPPCHAAAGIARTARIPAQPHRVIAFGCHRRHCGGISAAPHSLRSHAPSPALPPPLLHGTADRLQRRQEACHHSRHRRRRLRRRHLRRRLGRHRRRHRGLGRRLRRYGRRRTRTPRCLRPARPLQLHPPLALQPLPPSRPCHGDGLPPRLRPPASTATASASWAATR